ncbi:hypothetical protein SAMN05192553_101136 [Cyclobacterium xiamenense]|uniref:Uncharacterized protein n=2 Tax=Cyclobacterium xiamenense TaxID=1297121 RepID=A0A1H6T6S8_9BACT|nr:hypothetical protein SAMN05192553_101136 [Cyclobacterium xiamenense]
MDPDVLYVKLRKQIGFCYWQANAHVEAIIHFQKVTENLAQYLHPSLYFQVVGLLIRCNWQIQEFRKALYWAEIPLKNQEATSSTFEKLTNRKEYTDVLTDFNEPFHKDYEPIIGCVIAYLGFREPPTDPIETINTIRTTNRIWNRKLSVIELEYAYSKDCDDLLFPSKTSGSTARLPGIECMQ